MRQDRFSEGQIIGVLREQESGAMTAEVCRRHGISEQTLDAGFPEPGSHPSGWRQRRMAGVRSFASFSRAVAISSLRRPAPLRIAMPYSRQNARIWLLSAVRFATIRSRTRCSACRSIVSVRRRAPFDERARHVKARDLA
jgi:hypothetical protein